MKQPANRPAGPATLAARLDRRVVPALQRGARVVARAIGWPFRVLTRWEDRIASGRLVGSVYPRRGLLLLLIGLIAFVGSAVHLERYPGIREAERRAEAAAREQSVTRPGDGVAGASTDAPVVEVGPVVDAGVAEYVADRRAALDALDATAGPVLAVVSLSDYRAADEVAELLPEGVTALYAQYRIPAEFEEPVQTEVVRGDLVGSVDRAVEVVRREIVAEEADVRELIDSGTVEAEDFLADLEARQSELAAIRNLLDAGAEVVFAVVVRAPVEDLRALAAAEGVRVVDPAPPDAQADRSVFYGVLPEDQDQVTYGRLP